MMAKIVKGSDFKGVVDYILDKGKNAQFVAYKDLFMENRETIAMSFNAQSQMNGKVAKPVGHIALSFSKEDEPRLTNRVMAGIALEYMERMRIKNTQFFIARHFDKEHPHVHIAFNRIDNNGNTISDRHERLRSTRICKELTLKYGLHMAKGKDHVKTERLREPDKTKYELYSLLKTEVRKAGNWKELIAGLSEKGVNVRFKYKGNSDEVQGIVFIMNGYSFSGSKIDRQCSYSKIDAALKTPSHSETQRQVVVQSEPTWQQEPHGYELYSGSLGLFTPNPQPEQPEGYPNDYLRKKKKKKQRKIRW